MKTTKFKLIATVLLLITVVGFLLYGLHLYNKKPIHTKKVNFEFNISAKNITNEYSSNEKAANKKYVNKVIKVSGTIAEINFQNGNSIIVLKNSNNKVKIICNMLPEENIKVIKFKKGDIVNIKGFCTGFLLDVMVERCILVN